MEKQKRFFPLFINMEHKKVLVFGGGTIAARRVEAFWRFGADVHVVAPQIAEEILALTQKRNEEYGTVTVEQRPYRRSEIADVDYVVAATNDEQTNLIIGRECRHKDILVNVASDKSMCDFYFPGLVETRDFVIGITANGTDHGAVKKLREKIEKQMPQLLENPLE